MRKDDQNSEEMMWLAKGKVSELEKIKRFSIGQYLELLKYTINKTDKNV